MNIQTQSTKWNRLLRILVTATIIGGFAVLLVLLIFPSDVENVLFAGFSLRRLLITALVLVILAILILLLIGLFKPNKFVQALGKRLSAVLGNDYAVGFALSILSLAFISILLSLLLFWFPQSQRIFPFIKDVQIFQLIAIRAMPILIWAVLIIGTLIIAIYEFSRQNTGVKSDFPTRALGVSLGLSAFLFLTFAVLTALGQKFTAQDILRAAWSSLGMSAWFAVWVILSRRTHLTQKVILLFECITIWLIVFLVSVNVVQWFSALHTSGQNSFNLLADAFLRGRLYIVNPSVTYDLTQFNGKWYVPFPPFPALLMVPFVAILGISAFNTTLFSISLAAVASVVLYLALRQMRNEKWIDLSLAGLIWLVCLFSAGTVLWWLSLVSNASFTSQIVTVLCIGLAFLFTLRKSSAWLAGLCLAGAILSRPNTFVIWPALLAICIQLSQSEENKINWRAVLRWSTGSVIPAIIGVSLLLAYNYVRFANPLDFGYTTVNGAEWLVSKAQLYGVFSTHFIPDNLYWMFVGLPAKTISECSNFFPRGNGMGLLLATPAYIYAFRRFKLSWWTAGCWSSIFLSIALLSMYHNNGAIQISYRYVLDFAFPLIMLIAFAAGRKTSAVLKILIILSVLISYYGIVSWFMSPC